MMLPSPVTSTPFSVKDILNLEQQQQDPHYGAQLPHHLEHHFHPAACLLAAADGARFSDGEEEEEEEKLSYLSPMAAPGSQADARISADNYVHAVLRGSCEAPGPGEELDPAARDPSDCVLKKPLDAAEKAEEAERPKQRSRRKPRVLFSQA
ncbi:NKX23 protein, partial [Stercorarius parasiticus]|nr:NKX23 protein [Stercorarius parasiticus]